VTPDIAGLCATPTKRRKSGTSSRSDFFTAPLRRRPQIDGMDPLFFVLAWLAYVGLFWAALILLDRRQDGSCRKWLTGPWEFLRRLYARGRNFAAPK
jgi:hypothetical protein